MDETQGRIRILPPETAKKIAAGEVIDRPAAVARELLDNALDSGAKSVALELFGGGLERLRVVDDGEGMNAIDLAACVLPHATSKISSIDDLERLSTLGFRGEALASIAAVARLEIVSARRGSGGHRLLASPGNETTVEPSAARPGTAVEVAGLFADFPARRRFMKRPSSEAALCRQVLLDKALPYPAVEFRYASEGKLLLFLPAASRVERAVACLSGEAPASAYEELVFSGQGFSGRVVSAGAIHWRNDRRAMLVFANGRRIQEYGLVQALDWAFEGFLPGGAHPLAVLLLDIDPALVDFNVHPAKREARFRDLESVRRAIVRAIQDRLRSGSGFGLRSPLARDAEARQEALSFGAQGPRPSGLATSPAGPPAAYGQAAWDRVADLARSVRERASGAAGVYEPETRTPGGTEPSAEPFRYLGRALGVFLVYELDGALWLLDQHAAHERLLFDAMTARAPVVQDLLVPLELPVRDDEEDAYLESVREELSAAGWRIARDGASWLLEALPAGLKAQDAGALLDLLRRRPTVAEIGREARASAACRAAVKDGDELDPAAARELIARALELPVPRCPHGRPVAVRLGKDELFKLVERTL